MEAGCFATRSLVLGVQVFLQVPPSASHTGSARSKAGGGHRRCEPSLEPTHFEIDVMCDIILAQIEAELGSLHIVQTRPFECRSRLWTFVSSYFYYSYNHVIPIPRKMPKSIVKRIRDITSRS